MPARVFEDQTGLQQNRRRADTRLPMPVLAVGGQYSVGEGMLATMELVPTDARSENIRGGGHSVLGETPDAVAEALLQFVRAH